MEDQKINLLKSSMPFLPDKYFRRRETPLVKTIYPFVPGYVPPDKPDPVKKLITGQQLKYICPRLDNKRANHLADKFNTVLDKYPELQDVGVLHEMVAQAAKESAEFTTKSEGMVYSTTARLLAVFPSYIKTQAQAERYLRNPEALGDLVYGNRNGNGVNDGYKFRGGTFMMLTFRPTWEAWAKWNGLDVEKALELGRTDDLYAFDAVCWYFAVHRSLVGHAQRDEFETITRKVTGSKIGYSERLVYYTRAKEVLV